MPYHKLNSADLIFLDMRNTPLSKIVTTLNGKKIKLNIYINLETDGSTCSKKAF